MQAVEKAGPELFEEEFHIDFVCATNLLPVNKNIRSWVEQDVVYDNDGR